MVVEALQDIVLEETAKAAKNAKKSHDSSMKSKPKDMHDQEFLLQREEEGEILTAVQRAFKNMDANADGTVSINMVTTFLSGLKPHQRPLWAKKMGPEVEQKMKKRLATFDSDGDHELSLSELTEFWYSHAQHENFYDDHERLGAKAPRLHEEVYIEELPPATSFEALRRTDEPRVLAALEEIVIGEMEDAAEEAVDYHRDSVEDKPENVTHHEWLKKRELDGEELTAAEKAYRDMKKKKSGNISIAEVTRFLFETHPERRPVWLAVVDISQQNKVKKTLAKYDRDGDNELSIEEFIEWWASHPGHEAAYGERGIQTLISVDDMVTPRSPSAKSGAVVGI